MPSRSYQPCVSFKIEQEFSSTEFGRPTQAALLPYIAPLVSTSCPGPPQPAVLPPCHPPPTLPHPPSFAGERPMWGDSYVRAYSIALRTLLPWGCVDRKACEGRKLRIRMLVKEQLQPLVRPVVACFHNSLHAFCARSKPEGLCSSCCWSCC